MDIWPLMNLEVVTPMLTLRYIDDQLAVELARLAARGVHDPATMPFSRPWTDVESPELERNTLRFYWRARAETCVEYWDIQLAAIVDEKVIGMCSIEARDFVHRRSAETGSWIGRAFQRRGYGREMRRAALHMVFDGLGGQQAITRAWHDNAASLAVTRGFPYAQTGSSREQRRDHPDTMLHFAMTPRQWNTVPHSDIRLSGTADVRALLGLAS